MFAGVARVGVACAVLLSGSAVGMTAAFADEMLFPLRSQGETVGVESISTADLSVHFNEYTLVDARSEYEYETLNIEGAESAPLSHSRFDRDVRALAEKTKKPLVFYGNGAACETSYKAAVRALRAGVASVFVYDAGVFHWAEANPGKASLLDKEVKSSNQLISMADFSVHLLAPQRFYERVMSDPKALVLDIREAGQRDGISLFHMREVHVTLYSGRLEDWVDRAKKENRPLFIVDATGQQVQWLQYYLKEEGIGNYWFMKGGAKAFYEAL